MSTDSSEPHSQIDALNASIARMSAGQVRELLVSAFTDMDDDRRAKVLEHIVEVRYARGRCRRAERLKNRKSRRRALKAAVIALLDAGNTDRQIAVITGLSLPRVHDLLSWRASKAESSAACSAAASRRVG
jgi:hypothetical protein